LRRIFAALVVTLVFAAPISASRDVVEADAQYTPESPLPTAPPDRSGPTTITEGGTYSGNWLSVDLTPTVRIATSEPVTIVNSTVMNLGGGTLVEIPASSEGNVTLDHVVALGGNGRFVSARGFKSVTIQNCTIKRTGGIHLVTPVANSSVLVTRNRQRNVQKGAGVRQFVQLGEVQNASVDVSWNEIINEFGKSEVEDVISVFKSAHARIHDNYLQGGYPLKNVAQSSANGITVEVGDGTGPTSVDNEIWNNVVVDNVGGIGLVGGRDNYAHHNRIVQDGRLTSDARPGRPGRSATLLAANLGLGVWNLGALPGFTNNHARYNVVGYVHASGRRNDFWLPGAPDDYALNTSIRGRVTRTTEKAEWTRWLATLAVNRIRVGA
jgi:hypothetical protein